MTISMYQASVPVFIRMLTNLKGILGKAAAHAQAKKIDESVLLNARLYPDMFPLVKQVHIATDFARGTGARLSGNEPPSYEDNEKSLAELVARVERTLDFLRTLKPAAIDGSETREIVRPVRGEPKKFTGINLSAAVRDAELLLPHDNGLRDPPTFRRGTRQGRFHRRARLALRT